MGYMDKVLSVTYKAAMTISVFGFITTKIYFHFPWNISNHYY